VGNFVAETVGKVVGLFVGTFTDTAAKLISASSTDPEILKY
jgi:hypothetical protein